VWSLTTIHCGATESQPLDTKRCNYCYQVGAIRPRRGAAMLLSRGWYCA
jgi:hypothetical protein